MKTVLDAPVIAPKPLAAVSAGLQYRNLARHLLWKDLKIKYRGSLLGFVWSLANPLLMISVYTLAFKFVMKSTVPDYSYFLLIGLLPWNFFAQAAMQSTTAILDNASLIRKLHFPLEYLPAATVLFSLFHFIMAFAVLLPLSFFVFGSHLSWVLLTFVPLLAMQIALTMGVAFVLSTGTVYFRDIKHLTEVVFMAGFWLTPVIYDITQVPERFRPFLYLNPFTAFVVGYRDILFHQRLPSVETFFIAFAYSSLVLIAGWKLFERHKHQFAEIV